MENINRRSTILVVDDEAVNIQVMYELLSDEYDIKIAKDGKKALEIINGYDKPDLILLDVVMPQISGYDVCKTLKNNPSTQNIPIIFVTGNDSPIDEEHGLNLGAVDYIKKPFHPSIVKARVKNHINLKLKSDILEELSMFDSLTHLPNRRFFDEKLETKYKESVREHVSFAVMMIDIDHFKRYNDNYGHGRGDYVLSKVAQTMKRCLKRPFDFIARYGGEEFVAILKDIDAQGAQKVASDMIEAVCSLHIEHNFSDTAKFVTVSIGLCIMPANSQKPKEDILNKADEMLYQAKEEGRNRYKIYTLT